MKDDAIRNFLEIHARVVKEREEQEWEWIAGLRAIGIAAAHPDDGWVDRENNIVTFCYPFFDDNAQIGNLAVLGWPFNDFYRIVLLTGDASWGPFNLTCGTHMKRFKFQEVEWLQKP